MEWYDIRTRADKFRALNIVIGGRGIGKTYSALSFMLELQAASGAPFIYMRNTEKQMKECAGQFGNPFKKINRDNNIDIRIETEEEHWIIRDWTDKDDKKLVGYGCALSTFGNLRGVDLSDVQYVVFDEFIERRKLTFDQFYNFQVFFETVNRNRELLGEPPLVCILLSNSQKLDNSILIGYNLIPVIERMIANKEKSYTSKGVFLELPESSVSALKRNTIQYQMIAGSQYAAEALDNKFAYDSFYGIKQQKIQEFKPVCRIDNITVYKHKSKMLYYACTIYADTLEFDSKSSRLLFMRQFGQYFRELYAQNKFTYSDFFTKNKFEKLIGM